MGSLIFIPFVMGAVMLAAALWVRFTCRPILNILDYTKVRDIRGLHRWASNRLLLLPVASASMDVVLLTRPQLGLAMLFVNIVAILGVVGWLIVGSKKFTVETPIDAPGAK